MCLDDPSHPDITPAWIYQVATLLLGARHHGAVYYLSPRTKHVVWEGGVLVLGWSLLSYGDGKFLGEKLGI